MGMPQMNIGIYQKHGFLITNLDKVTNNYSCAECQARFTQACNCSVIQRRATKGRRKGSAGGKKTRQNRRFKKTFIRRGRLATKQSVGWNTSRGDGTFTFINKCATMLGNELCGACSGWLLFGTTYSVPVLWLAIGTAVRIVIRSRNEDRKK